MIVKEDLISIKEIIEKHEENINYKNLYDKINLLLKGIELQEELNKNSDDLQTLIDKVNKNEKKEGK